MTAPVSNNQPSQNQNLSKIVSDKAVQTFAKSAVQKTLSEATQQKNK